MPTFFPFFVVLLVSVMFSYLFNRMKIPWVVALIVGGIMIGPHGFGFIEPDATLNFIAQIGLVFLMFMAGLETRLSDVTNLKGKIAIIASLSGLIPALTGFLIGMAFGYSLTTAALLGVIFMASSVALLIPIFQAQKVFDSQLGKVIIGSAILVDTTALILLSFLLKIFESGMDLFAFLFYPLIFIALVLFAKIIPKLRWLTFTDYAEEHDLFEKELRFVILILIGLVVIFELVGLHSIIAGFFAGLVLSQSMESKILKAKLHAISYGFFIPAFFIVVGANTNISIFRDADAAVILAASIIAGSIASKFFSGWLGGRLTRFTNQESVFLGISTTPSLSTTLAVAFLGFGQGIFDEALLTSIVALSLATSMSAPIIVNRLGGKLESQRTIISE